MRTFNPRLSILVSLAVLAFIVIIALQAMTFSRDPVSNALPEVRARNGDASAQWVWNSGANKPLIRLGDDTVVEISGWASDIKVDNGDPVLLWHHYMGANAIGDSLYSTYSRPEEYLLEQQIVLLDGNRATIEYFVVPFRPIKTLELRLGHYKRWWNEIKVNGNTFEGTSDNSWVRITFGSNFRAIEIDRAASRSNSFDAYFMATDIRERTLIAGETIEFGKR